MTKALNHMRRALGFASTIALTGFVVPAAHAQEAAPDEQTSEAPSQGNEIIVTAQRRSERLQDVPIAISALGSEQLANAGATDISALRGAVPGLTISNSAGINASNLVSIRGVGGLAVPIGTSQAVAFYVDGVYLSRPDAAFFSLDDVERVEVLRGPQGTLYGRNATAGAINIITREPGDILAGGFDVRTGNYNSINVRGSVSGPLGGGFSAGVSGSYDRRDGYYFNTVTDARVKGERGFTVRGKLRYSSPDDSFSAVLTGDHSRRDGRLYIRNQYSSVAPPSSFVGIGDPDLISFDALTDQQAKTDIRGTGVALTLSYSAGPVDITSVTAHREIDSLIIYDVDGTALPAVISASDNRGKTFSQELRAVYSNGPLDLTVGGNYYREKASVGFLSQSPAAPLRYTNPFTSTTVDAFALFAQVEYEIVDRLTLVGGLRLNREQRDFLVDYTAAPTPGGRATGKLSDTAVIPSVGVNFAANDDVLLYAKASRGYQAPGYNGFVGVASASLVNTFDAENLTAYEVGVKSQFLDRRVTLNMAGFYYDYSDLQVRSVFSTARIVVNNAASSRIKGAEASLVVEPVDFFSLSGQLTYLDAKYNAFCEAVTAGSPQAADPLCSPGLADRSGNRLNQAPKWSGAVMANLDLPLASDVRLKGNMTYSWESNVFFTPPNEPIVSSGGWNRLDAKLGLELSDALEVYVYGKNLTDKIYISYSGRGSPLLAQAGLNDPRTYGAGLRYRF